MLVEQGLEQLFFTTCRVAGSGVDADGEPQSWTGTGFVYQVNIDGPQGLGQAPFVVSNKHVLCPDEMANVNLSFTFVKKAQNDQPDYGVPFTGGFPLNAVPYSPHPDPDVDVAALPLAPLLDAMKASGEPFYRSLAPELLLNDAATADLLAIEDLVFVGYPTGIFDSRNVVPVVRRGITATPIMLDYEGRPAFLLDGGVWPGSSGSPVLIANQGAYATRTGTVVGSRTHLVGVLAAVHVHQDLIPVVPLPTTAGSAGVLRSPIGLGIVFKAKAINDCVDAVLTANSLTRVQTPTEVTPS